MASDSKSIDSFHSQSFDQKEPLLMACPLLRLPSEIRIAIYKAVFDFDELNLPQTVRLLNSGRNLERIRPTPHSLALLSTSNMVRQDATPVAISRIEFRTTIRTGLIPLLLGPNPAYTVHLRYLSVPLFDCEANSWALREFYDNVDDKVVTDQREAFDASLKQHVKYPLEVLTMTLTDRHVTTDRRHLGDRMTMAVHSFFQRWQQISGPKTLILRFTTVLERGFCHVGFRDFGKRLKRAKIPDSIISIHWRDWAVRSPESELFGMALERHGSCGSELVLKVSMSATTEQKQAVLNIRRKSEWFWAASNIHGEDTDLDDGTDSMRSTSDSESEDFD